MSATRITTPAPAATRHEKGVLGWIARQLEWERTLTDLRAAATGAVGAPAPRVTQRQTQAA